MVPNLLDAFFPLVHSGNRKTKTSITENCPHVHVILICSKLSLIFDLNIHFPSVKWHCIHSVCSWLSSKKSLFFPVSFVLSSRTNHENSKGTRDCFRLTYFPCGHEHRKAYVWLKYARCKRWPRHESK